MFVRRAASLSAVVALALTAGCGSDDRPPLGRVWGTVTYNGKPLESGEVVFSPVLDSAARTGQPAIGTISNGSYTMTTFDDGDGALVGDHIVTVKSNEVIRSEKPRKNDVEKIRTPGPDGKLSYVTLKSRIPARYGNPNKTPLRYTVKPQSNEYTIELTD
jgi:hypothetical protein